MIGKSLGEKRVARIAESLANSVGLDLMTLAFRKNGILNAENDDVSGENFFLNSFLKSEFKRRSITNPVIFDVGANIGKYTKRVSQTFPYASIFSFEPNPNSFKSLSATIDQLSNPNIRIFNLGLSEKEQRKTMYSYESDTSSSHASLLPKVLTDLHRSTNNVSIDAGFTSLDNFCAETKVGHVNFLKIDTEGHELAVLRGAAEMISRNAVDYIQFEFGECHVYSRVFFRDFFTTLDNYRLYRLMPGSMRLLVDYSPDLEIFHFQNIVAVRKDLSQESHGV